MDLDSESQFNTKYFLIEYFKSVREEILLRVKWRDGFLKFQIISIIVIFGIANKLKILEAFSSNDTEHPEILLLTPIISFVVCLLYLIEDNVIAALSDYCRAVCVAEKEINKSTKLLRNYDTSLQLLAGNDSKWTKRSLVQICLFVIIPTIFSGYGFSRVSKIENVHGIYNLLLSTDFYKWSIYQVVFWFGIIVTIATIGIIIMANRKRLEFKEKSSIELIYD